MSAHPCEDFRALLSSGRLPACGEAASNWQCHIVECASCRELLAEEERFDELLASIPQPEVPQELAKRVRSALEPMRRRQREELALDRLLDLVPEPQTPRDLASGVLNALRSERQATPAWRRGYSIALAAAAALLFAVFLAWSKPTTLSPEPLPAKEELAQLAEGFEPREFETEDELVLYALENSELLMSDEVEVYLASLDPAEFLVLELEALEEVLEEETGTRQFDARDDTGNEER